MSHFTTLTSKCIKFIPKPLIVLAKRKTFEQKIYSQTNSCFFRTWACANLYLTLSLLQESLQFWLHNNCNMQFCECRLGNGRAHLNAWNCLNHHHPPWSLRTNKDFSFYLSRKKIKSLKPWALTASLLSLSILRLWIGSSKLDRFKASAGEHSNKPLQCRYNPQSGRFALKLH